MTDQAINRAIAEALTARGFAEALAWSPARTCPNGHDNYENDCGAPDEAIGNRCVYCDAVIQRGEPHDFTDPRYLMPVLEAYCAEYRLEFTCEPYEGGAWFVRFVERDANRTIAEAKAFVEALETEKGEDH